MKKYKKIYCKDCEKLLNKNACYYGTKRCYICAGKLRRKNIKKYCIDCGKLLCKQAYYFKTKRCVFCASKASKGKKHSLTTRKRMSKAQKKRFKDPKERKKISDANIKRFKNPKERKKISLILKNKYKKNPRDKKYMENAWKTRKGSKHSKKTKQKISNSLKGLKVSLKIRKKISLGHGGTGTPYENSGYDYKFNYAYKEMIRKRDNYICQLCGAIHKKNDRKLDVHHIDYDKKNTQPSNNNSLCKSCNAKVNKDREKWTEYFQELMNKKYGYIYIKK